MPASPMHLTTCPEVSSNLLARIRDLLFRESPWAFLGFDSPLVLTYGDLVAEPWSKLPAETSTSALHRVSNIGLL